MTTAILLFGYPGSGKGTALNVAEQHNTPTISMGDVVRTAAKRAYSITDDPSELDTIDNDIVGPYATTMRELHGFDVMAKLTVKQIQESPLKNSDVIVVDGLRGVPEVEVMTENFDKVMTVYIKANQKTRLQRLQNRARDESESNLTIDGLQERDEREGKWGLDELAEQDQYDVALRNEGSLNEFKAKVTDLLENYLRTDPNSTLQ